MERFYNCLYFIDEETEKHRSELSTAGIEYSVFRVWLTLTSEFLGSESDPVPGGEGRAVQTRNIKLYNCH